MQVVTAQPFVDALTSTAPPPPPNTWLAWSIISLLCCCWPLGLVALTCSIMVKSCTCIWLYTALFCEHNPTYYII